MIIEETRTGHDARCVFEAVRCRTYPNRRGTTEIHFSPPSLERKPDNSFMIGSGSKFRRGHREAFDTILSEHEAPPRRDSSAGPQTEMDVIPHIEDEYIGFDTVSDETWARIMTSAPGRVPFAPSRRTLRESISSLLSLTRAGSTRNRGFAICRRRAMARRTGFS